MFKSNTVTNIFWRTAIDAVDFDKREVFFTFTRGTYLTCYGISSLQTHSANLVLTYVNVIRRVEVIKVRTS